MAKIGRNEPCPCGSGKKYKKCCVDTSDKPKDISLGQKFMQYLESFWRYEKVNEMSTDEIIQRLESMGVIFDKDAFLEDVENFYSAQQISENWFDSFNVTAKGRDEDFPFLAAWILWERLAPAHVLSEEQMSDLIDKGYKYSSEHDWKTVCGIWLKVWESLKYKSKPEHKNLDFLDTQYRGSFFASNFCQDLEAELYNAGLEDSAYFERRIHYCREFLKFFPEETELIVHNMRRSIAESYFFLGEYEQADFEYRGLVRDYPFNPWGYIGWGDMCVADETKDYAKAEELYKRALAIANDKADIMVIEQRLEQLGCEMPK